MAWTRKTRSGGVAACWRDPEGTERSKSFKAGEEQRAMKYALRKESEVERDDYNDPKAGRITLQALYDQIHGNRSYAPATVKLHKSVWGAPNDSSHALYQLKHKQIRHITSSSVEAALAKIERPFMKEKTRLVLSGLFNEAINMKPPQLRENPARLFTRQPTRSEKMERGHTAKPKAQRYLSTEELARLLTENPAPIRALAHLMARCGLRPGEGVALRVGKFDPMQRALVVDTAASGFTKTGESRTLTLPAFISDELVEHLARHSDPSDPDALMFPNPAGAMYTLDAFRFQIQHAAKRAGLREMVPNDLRHTAVSWAISLGASVYDVQKMVGHAKPSITLDVYGELWKDGAKRLADKMDAALRAEADQTPTDSAVVSISR
jgi:integrase